MTSLAGQTILIAEDEPFMRNVLETTLLREGAAKVCAFDNGMDVIDFLSGKTVNGIDPCPIDIALLDFMMPKAHGLYVLKEIRIGKTRHAPGLPVGMLTSASDNRTVAMSVRLDCNAFIIKPLFKPVLLQKLNRLVALKGRHGRHVSFYFDVDVGDPEAFDEDQARQEYEDPTANIMPDFPELPAEASTGNPEAAPGNWVPLSDLRVGMVLAADLAVRKGSVIVQKGTVVTPEILAVLQDLEKILPNLGARIVV